MKNGKPVLVTTDKRGVFFGYIQTIPTAVPKSLKLKKAKNCIYWSKDMMGFLGLASKGPSEACRIGPEVLELTLFGITSIALCSDVAVERWLGAK